MGGSSDLLAPSPTEQTGPHSQSIQVASLASFTDSGSSFHTPVTPLSSSETKQPSTRGHNRVSNLGPRPLHPIPPPHEPLADPSMGRYLDEQHAMFRHENGSSRHSSGRSLLERARQEHRQASGSSQESSRGSGHGPSSGTSRSQRSQARPPRPQRDLQLVHLQHAPPYESPHATRAASSQPFDVSDAGLGKPLRHSDPEGAMSAPSKRLRRGHSRPTLQPHAQQPLPGSFPGATQDQPQELDRTSPIEATFGSSPWISEPYTTEYTATSRAEVAEGSDRGHPGELNLRMMPPSGWELAVGDLPSASPQSHTMNPLFERTSPHSFLSSSPAVLQGPEEPLHPLTQHPRQALPDSESIHGRLQADAADAANSANAAGFRASRDTAQGRPHVPATSSVPRGPSKRSTAPLPEAILDSVSDFDQDEGLDIEAGPPRSETQSPDASRPESSSRGGPSPRDEASLRSPGWRAVTEDSPPASRESSVTWARQGVAGYVASLVGTWERLIASAPSIRRSPGAIPTTIITIGTITIAIVITSLPATGMAIPVYAFVYARMVIHTMVKLERGDEHEADPKAVA